VNWIQEITIEEDLMHSTTVIVRVKNEEQLIGNALQSIIDHIDNAKIIIVDNNSSDNSINIARLFQHDTSKPKSDRYADIEIIKINEYSPGKAINLALKKVNTENLLLLSSHCEISKYSCELVNNLLETHVAVFGKQVPRYFGKRIVPRYIWSHYGEEASINMFSNLEDRYFLHNAFCCYKTDFLKKNLFNENLVGKEDRYWANDVIKAGRTYIYEPNLVCQHHFTNNGNTWRGID
tara:strand:+ start:775 stop:1482 length:708 start_codon:yes stop_codon:yes gene_type:complete